MSVSSMGDAAVSRRPRASPSTARSFASICRSAVDWPDWRGQAAVIAATGPSCTAAALDSFKGKARLIAINRAWLLAPDWCDVVYASDGAWWIGQGGLPAFKGLKLTGSLNAARLFAGLHAIGVRKSEAILLGETGIVGCGSLQGGGHSGFHALNLAVQFGSNPITLIGFDMSNGHPDTKIHRVVLNRAIEQMAAIGVRVCHGGDHQG